MHNLVTDGSKTIVVLINDFYPEFSVAIDKLSATLHRPLRGLLLVDKSVKDTNQNLPDTSNTFTEVVCDFSDPSSVQKALHDIRNNILLITCGSERNQPYLKAILPYVPHVYGPTESSIDWSIHKHDMREHLESYNSELTPKYRLVTSNTTEGIEELVHGLTFPLIVKPNGLAASLLVTKVYSKTELADTLLKSFKNIGSIYKRDKGRGKPSMIVEEFIEGDMYSVDSYVNETGTVWSLPLTKVTTAHSVGLEGFYSYRIDTELDLDADEIAQAHATAEQAIHALGLRSCVAHIELFNTKSGWKVIELGPRAGGYRQEMYELAYGIDHAYNELLVKVGLPPKINTIPVAYAAVVNIYAEKEGRIQSIEGFEEASKNPSIAWLKLHKNPNDIALFCGNGGKYVVDGVLSNQSIDQLNQDMSHVRELINIKISESL